MGPAIQGSPDVSVNRRPALRVDDPGVHTACCGLNTWTANAGSTTVFINGKSAHRMGDPTRHCGGMGRLVEGSPNVIVGETSAGGGGRNRSGGTRAGDPADGSGGANGSRGAARAEPVETASSARSRAASSTPPAGSGADAQARPRDADTAHHVELELEDSDGRPLAGATYKLVASDGTVHTGTLDSTGKARVDQLPEGTCELTFTDVGNNPRSSV